MNMKEKQEYEFKTKIINAWTLFCINNNLAFQGIEFDNNLIICKGRR